MTSPTIDTRVQTKVAEFDSYPEAERAVDHLSDRHFPVEHLTIVGCDLRLEEQVVGRLDWGRAALAGIATGAWLGLLIGVLFAVFAESTSGAFGVMLGCAGYGAVFGAAFALIAYAMTRGRHDYLSRSAIVPARFELLVESAHAERARDLLTAAR